MQKDLLIIGCNGRIFALRASTGEIIWENDLKGMGFNEVALARQGTSTQYITKVVEHITSSNSNA